MELKNLAKGTLLTLGFLFINGESALADVSESEQVSKISQLPKERCEKDLSQLRAIYAQAANMADDERSEFLKAIGKALEEQGSRLPPPPAPCSRVHLALEQRCGNVSSACSQTESKASEAAPNDGRN